MESKILNLIKDNEELTSSILESFIYGVGIDSFNRMYWFYKLQRLGGYKINDSNYWSSLKCAYTSSDNIHLQLPYLFLKKLFLTDRQNRELLMSETERTYLESLPESVKIYRGCSLKEKNKKEFGISWTLSKKRAEFYTIFYRNGVKDGVLIEKEINKKDIIAYFSDRDEQEIIYI